MEPPAHVKQPAEALLKETSEGVAREIELGAAFSFAPSVETFRKAQIASQRILRSDFSIVPDSVSVSLSNGLNQFMSVLGRMRAFRANQPDALAARQQLMLEIEATYLNAIFPLVGQIVAASPPETGTAQIVESARAALAETQAAQVQAKQIAADAAKALAAAQEASVKAGVTAQAIHFGNRATAHVKAGVAWLVTTVLLIAIAVIVALAVFDPSLGLHVFGLGPGTPPAPDGSAVTAALVRQLVARVIVLSLLLYAVVLAARNYRAHRHNAVLNQHRQTALQTFDAFVKGTSDDQTKNAVLLQATQAVFSTQPSGYLTSEAEPLPQTTIVEILRKLGPEKS
jgi:hypothetical protein